MRDRRTDMLISKNRLSWGCARSPHVYNHRFCATRSEEKLVLFAPALHRTVHTNSIYLMMPLIPKD